MTELYKKDSKGRLRIWKVRTDGAMLIEEYGFLDGKHTRNQKMCTSKNVGKSNQTSPEEQAVLEMESKIREKLQEDYFKTKDEALSQLVMLPMLAKDYEKQGKKVDWDRRVYGQPKLDGMRCLAIVTMVNGEIQVKLISRKGVEITTLQHINQAVANMVDLYDPLFDDSIVFDGELYAHGLTFQENMSLIKKYREDETEKICYHLYDLVTDEPFEDRTEILEECFYQQSEDCLELVETTILKKEMLAEFHAKNLNNGYEGTMIRHSEEPYKINGRSDSLLKYKDFKDLSAEIIDVIPMEARPEHGLVVARVFGKVFKATPKMSHAEREQLLIDKEDYIGKQGEFRYFEETDDGLPRFPVFKGLRLDK